MMHDKQSLLTLALLCSLSSGCSIHDPDVPNYTSDSLCAGIYQKLHPGTDGNIPTSNSVVTATEQANLLKEYNRLGCPSTSDNRYALPTESLAINEEINDRPVDPPISATSPSPVKRLHHRVNRQQP